MLAVLTVGVLGKVFAYDYLTQGWANIFAAEQQTQTQDYKPYIKSQQLAQTSQDTVAQDQSQTAQGTTQAETPAQDAKLTEIQKLLEDIKLNTEKLTPEQLTSVGFKSAKITPVTFEGRVFQIVDVSDILNAHSGEFNITDGKNIFAVVAEMQFQTQLEAQDVFNLVKTRIKGMPGVSINESNTFGDGSYFMNDSKRIGSAFLVVRIKNTVYFYTYPKTNNTFIKNLIILLNQ
ncbi:TPA: hypothetical protein DCZ16_02750 [Candidatus Peregrinibacteria bacterium]|nr:hypothetical protein [Candidatus Peregrinibacteria bacterium]